MVVLDLALTLAAAKLKICYDSQLVIGPIQREYEAKDECMTRYLTLVQVSPKLSEWVVKRVPRTKNVKVDALAEIAATLPIKEAVRLAIYLQATSSISATSICSTSEMDTNWMHKILKYLWTRELPGEEKQTHKIWVQAARFTLIRDNLYRLSFRGCTSSV